VAEVTLIGPLNLWLAGPGLLPGDFYNVGFGPFEAPGSFSLNFARGTWTVTGLPYVPDANPVIWVSDMSVQTIYSAAGSHQMFLWATFNNSGTVPINYFEVYISRVF
jgi:hypothetical protein